MAKKASKPFWKSKTFWLNTVGILIIVLQFVLQLESLVDPELQALILAFLNLLLRFKTEQKIEIKR